MMRTKIIDIRSTIPKHLARIWKFRHPSTIDTIVVHTTASDQQDPNITAQYHVTASPDNHLSPLGAPGIAYHDFIAKSGVIYHCNDYTDITWHTRGWNKRGIGIALAFRGQDPYPPASTQYNALVRRLVTLCLYLKILPKRVKGHREAPSVVFFDRNGSKRYKKVCPGLGINLDVLRDHVTRRLQVRLSAERLYKGKIDGKFGKKSKAALQAFNPRRSRFRRGK
jgi:N-acetyl-anhydromuramyl-L-alanine amidase AmpD